jgi:feruloyl esterase
MHRDGLVGAATGFAAVLIGSTSAMATPCTNLQTLALEQTTITSATDIRTGVFTIPESSPPQNLTGLPAFCRVNATLTPTVDSAIKIEVWLPESTWSGRFLGFGSGGRGLHRLQRPRTPP